MPRNASGVYTLPAGNPVVPGTTIDANWANSTLSDISNELTNSLSRTGAGGMLAPFRVADGNITAPGLAFLNETNSGYYRAGAGSFAFSIQGVNALQLTTTAITVPAGKSFSVVGNATVGGTFGVTGAIAAIGGVVGNVTGNVSGTASNVTGTVAIANGGTGATTAGGARTALDVPSTTGSGATGTWNIDVLGNAGTVTNGVYTTGSYNNPAWITALAGSKITGNITGNAANVTGTVAVANGGTGATTAAGARTALDVPSSTGGGASGTWGINISGNAATVTNGLYSSGSYADPSWITSLAASKLTGTLPISNGGTGASTASGARSAILPTYSGNALKFLRVNSGGTDVEWATESGAGTVTSVDASGGTTGLSFSGGPITSSGTLTMAGTLAVANGGTGSTTAAGARTTLGAAGTADANTFTANQTITANTSSDALKITQTGSGNALYIEDVAADATPFVVSSTGAVGIGTTTPDNVTSAGIALVSSNGYYPQIVNRNKANDTTASYLVFDKDRAGSIVQNGDGLGAIVWRSYDGASYLQSAAIIGYSDGAPGTNDVPGTLAFFTTADGAASPSERFRIAPTGAFGVNGTNYGSSGQVLTSNGSGAAPTWQSVGGTGTVTSVATGTGLTGGPITSSGTISLANTAVSAGSYTNANITVDAQGRITSASNGTSSGISAGKSIAFAMVFGG